MIRQGIDDPECPHWFLSPSWWIKTWSGTRPAGPCRLVLLLTVSHHRCDITVNEPERSTTIDDTAVLCLPLRAQIRAALRRRSQDDYWRQTAAAVAEGGAYE